MAPDRLCSWIEVCFTAVEVRTDIPFSKVSGETPLMDAHILEGAGPFAAVILVHGGGWSNGSKQAEFIKPLFPVLHGSGLAWFSIDYRLSPKYRHSDADALDAPLR